MFSMENLLSWLITLISMAALVQSRTLMLNPEDKLLNSNGSNYSIKSQYKNTLYSGQISVSSNECLHIYGFFPCAYNIGGYIFQIILCQYLLYVGEMLVTKGSNRLFQIFRTGIYGASVFRILKVFPGLITVIVSGMIASKENAQMQVSLGVYIYAGSTIFSLTLFWLMCVVFGRKKIVNNISNAKSPETQSLLSKRKIYGFMETGITTDQATRNTAGIMLLSIVPFLIVQLVEFFTTSSRRRLMMLVALIISTISLFSYFLYQIKYPWMQKRSLEYTKYENMLVGFLHHAQLHANEKLVTEDGEPNLRVIRRLFHKIDKDEDKTLDLKEVEHMLLNMQFDNCHMDKNYVMSAVWKVLDKDGDGRIQENEFIEGIAGYIEEAKNLAEKQDFSNRGILNEVVRPGIKNKEKPLNIKHLMSRIMKHIHNQLLESEKLVNDDGSINIGHIKRLFKQLCKDGHRVITHSELDQLIQRVRFEEQTNRDEIVKKVLEDFDMDHNGTVDEEEFVLGLTKWINKAMHVAKRKDSKCIDHFHKIIWEEDISVSWGFSKSIAQILLGILMLTFLAKPLTISIIQFSSDIGWDSAIVSFIIVPIVLNGRRAVLAIFPASRKSEMTSSLTFSEIYSGVIMNNLIGLTTLLAIVYTKELRWDYSAEVLIITLVCAIMGCFAFLRTTYPLWTCTLGFLMYPISLLMFYVLKYQWGWN